MIHLQTNLELTPTQAEIVLCAWLGAPVACTDIRRLSGGMVNTVLRLEFDQAPYSAVIKLNTRAGNSFAQEAQALEYLHANTKFPSPQVYLHDGYAHLIPYAFLLLETAPGVCLEGLELPPTAHAALDVQLAEALLELHSHTRAGYGPIGAAAGQPGWSELFVARLVETRCAPQVGQRLPPAVLADVDYAIGIAASALLDQGVPTLIHGDLWDGNLIVRQENGQWRLAGIVDPALEYADVEAELAYLEVFDTSRQAFFAAYTARRALRTGYAWRRLFYWLHTALIHVGLFGDPFYCEYAANTAAAIRAGGSLG